ncbi:MAG: pyridoxamine 5'-phosphate oxidase family protein [Firmicutes bacterium]|nr:pyridoxamine 5'-phosphate oxidase family protein [Bacillota bacterium]
MRRKDREVTEKKDLLEIVENCVVCRLGLTVDNWPYIVPLNYGYTWGVNEPLRLYFHCAGKGQKLDMIMKNNLACFEMDGKHQLLTAKSACGHSFVYTSIIGWGKVAILTKDEEKRQALQKIMEHQAGPGAYTFGEEELAQVTVLCLETLEISGKKSS